jgi:arsenite-transporting ATPase
MSRLIDKKSILVTGKGGVGKSLVASVLAKQAASEGKRVCLMQCSIEDQIGPLFGKPPIGHVITQISPGIDCININLDLNFRDFIVYQLGFEKIFEQVFNNKLVKSFLGVIPGLRELALIGKVYHYARLEKTPYDLVIFDGFSSGHFLQLMTTPRAIFDSGIVGTVLNVTNKVNEFFRDSEACGTVVVTSSEYLPLTECVDLVAELKQRSPSVVTAIIFNRYPDDPDDSSSGCGQISGVDNSLAHLRQGFSHSQELTKEAVQSIQKIYGSSSQTPEFLVCRDCGIVPEPLSKETLSDLALRSYREPKGSKS